MSEYDKDNMDYESKNEVESIIKEIQDVTVTVENYKKYIDKISNTERVIMAQLENFVRNHRELKRKLKEKLESEKVKEAQRQGYVTQDLFVLQEDINQILRDSYSWKSMAAEMNKIFFSKITLVLEDINALDIKKGALEEIREMETKRNENQLAEINRIAGMTLEIVNHKLAMVDEKIINTVKLIEQESRNDKQSMINMFIESVNMNQKDKHRLIEILKISNADLEEASRKIKETIDKPIEKLKPNVYKDIEEDLEEDSENDNPFVIDDDEDDVESISDIDEEEEDERQ